MIDETIFSDEDLQTQQDFDQWEPAPEFAPPPPAATYDVYISEIRDAAEREVEKGKRLFTTVDFRIIGGQYDERAINFQRLNNVEFSRRDGKHTSFLLDLLASAGIQQAPRSNREFYLALKSLHDRGKGAPFKVQTDWEGTCADCYSKALMKLTSTTNSQAAKAVSLPAQRTEASKAGRKAKNYRAFPSNAAGQKMDIYVCPDCKGEMRAQQRVVRFLK